MPVTSPRPRPPGPVPPRQMVTYDRGLPSLPDDIIYEVFSRLDMEALKSCSLTGKALSCPAKPFIHRALYLTTRSGVYSTESKFFGPWDEFKGLEVLSERGLLQHTRHISISIPESHEIFPDDLEPHVQHLHTLTNLMSLKIRWLDIPSFIPDVEEYFGAFLGTLQSLELVFPVGDYRQIFYFICRFRNLRDLKIDGVRGYTDSMHTGGPRFDIESSPPLNGTLDLKLDMDTRPEGGSMGAELNLTNLITLPFGLKFRTIKLSGCTGNTLQPLVDACAQTLECMEFTGNWSGALFLPRGDRPRFIGFDYQPRAPVLGSVSNDTPRSENLQSNYPSAEARKKFPGGYPRHSRPSPRTYSPSLPFLSPHFTLQTRTECVGGTRLIMC